MAEKHTVSFYPVGNGDTSQIVLHAGQRFLFDFCHRPNAGSAEVPEIDLKATLHAELKAANKASFDVVAFTHADNDHICGFSEFFNLHHATKYQSKDRTDIDCLWVPAAVLVEEATNYCQSDEFVILRQEARHRLLEGKGILVFSQPEALMTWLRPKLEERGLAATSRDHLFVDAGKLVPGWTLANDHIEFFVHSPFIEHCDDGDMIRNSASLVLQVRVTADGHPYDYLEVGDAHWEDLERIVRTTKYHGNLDRLGFDIYNLPHHCSYLSLSDNKGETETVPKPLIKELLQCGRQSSYIVSCSKPIVDVKESYSQVQPPHIQARKAYTSANKAVNGRGFLVTMEEPNATRPQPIVFELTKPGITWKQSGLVGGLGMASTGSYKAGTQN